MADQKFAHRRLKNIKTSGLVTSEAGFRASIIRSLCLRSPSSWTPDISVSKIDSFRMLLRHPI